MTPQDEIIEMARQAFACKHTALPVSEERLKAFAKLVDAKATARERKACALVCEGLWISDGVDATAGDCADAILARGEA